jgi:phenylacetate-coenzyme A ligase PaaK-like adenylate-forming protein
MIPTIDSVRNQRLGRTLQAVAAAHPFYRARFRSLGIEAGDIRGLDDLVALPPTTKEDFIADPDAFRLRAEDLPPDFSVEERVLWDIAYTTGTTSGRPSPFYNTTHDAYAILDQARRCNETEGLRPDDRVANLYPLAGFPTGAFLSVVRSTMIMGLPVVHGLTGSANSEFKVRNSLAEALDKIERFRPTVLWGVPSFVRRFLDEARRHKADLASVRLVLTSGEPVSAAMRNEMREQLAAAGCGPVTVLARYAFTEMQGGFVQCNEEARPQNAVPDFYYLETVDPESGRRRGDGEDGMLAVTHLHRRGTVLLRYLVGDVVTLSREPCPICGRTGERIVTTPRRIGALVKCRGMLVNTDVVVETLSALEGIGQFQVLFRREDRPGAMDEMVVRIEFDDAECGGAGSHRRTRGSLREEVVRRVREAVSLRPEVAFEARGALYDHERSIKAKRVVDSRKTVE